MMMPLSSTCRWLRLIAVRNHEIFILSASRCKAHPGVPGSNIWIQSQTADAMPWTGPQWTQRSNTSSPTLSMLTMMFMSLCTVLAEWHDRWADRRTDSSWCMLACSMKFGSIASSHTFRCSTILGGFTDCLQVTGARRSQFWSASHDCKRQVLCVWHDDMNYCKTGQKQDWLTPYCVFAIIASLNVVILWISIASFCCVSVFPCCYRPLDIVFSCVFSHWLLSSWIMLNYCLLCVLQPCAFEKFFPKIEGK